MGVLMGCCWCKGGVFVVLVCNHRGCMLVFVLEGVYERREGVVLCGYVDWFLVYDIYFHITSHHIKCVLGGGR